MQFIRFLKFSVFFVHSFLKNSLFFAEKKKEKEEVHYIDRGELRRYYPSLPLV